ncbi:hypothetical protein [Pelomicrobium methylotrophicum]|uniref:Uncharacterized protein n=1 Tax=Pelomicrobium methylotrophicum TaxID=2602750 RepID=A0A5C7EKA7_9PROT|nr:hypothetical protein [Pelomicrobium methylotrophicum]TXF11911.1 hypothetical protein FR698_07865 [Pelomicrobium methylotrophicum]
MSDAVQRLRSLLAEAQSMNADYMHVTSTPRAMRAIGLRGKVVCEHPDGRRTYSVKTDKVVQRVQWVLDELEAAP